MSFDVYTMVTERIIKKLEKGNIPWNKPWIGANVELAISHGTGKPYSLLNQFLCEEPGEYATWKQIKDEGGRLRKGAKAQQIIFFKMNVKDTGEVDENGKAINKVYPVLVYYNVYNLKDVDGIEPTYYINNVPELPMFDVDEEAERIITDYTTRENVGVNRDKLSGQAYYNRLTDAITIPHIAQFEDKKAEYYSTIFHELTHSTGAPTRLNREKGKKFGDTAYSYEELIAEIGASSINNYLGLETVSSIDNSAAYIQSWIKALKNDKHLIVTATTKAQKAVEMILNIA